MISMNSKFFMM